MKQSKYIVSSRREQIVSYLRENGSAKVEELSELCKVSPLTIRRDLTELENLHIAHRIFGGAVLAKQIDTPATFEEKKSVHHNEKEKIAQEASKYVQDGMTVFMNSGTTILQVIKASLSKNITIVTNNALAYEYCSLANSEILCTGGLYSDLTKAYVGEFATKIVGKIYADLCILGVNGISASGGVTTSVLQETIVNDKMVERCIGKVIVVADGSKIGKIFNYVSVKLDHISFLITDDTADPVEIEKLRNAGVEVSILH